MKLKNVVEGIRIQAKREINGYAGEVIPKGTEVIVGMVQNPPIDSCPVRIDHEDISDGYAWVNPADFRKVKEVTEEPTEHVYKVGDKVLVGAEGAGYGIVRPDLAWEVCTISEVGHLDHRPECVGLVHPVHCPRGWSSLPKYISPYVEPVVVVPQRPEVGDWVVANAVDPNLVAGVAYKVVAVGSVPYITIELKTHRCADWQDGYCLLDTQYSTVLREVQPDADTST